MALGLITEYNPFHNGHLYHINKSKYKTKKNRVVVVMSGNFVQRGEPAILNKHIRTKMALLNGADLVLELPTIFATSGADLFALGAVDLLNKSNIVSSLCFGSEEGSLYYINKVANVLVNESETFKNNIKEELQKGISFPLARSNAVKNTLNLNLDFLNKPNNTLALEYLIALKKLKSSITPFTIKRSGPDFNSKVAVGTIASATAIRELLLSQDINKVSNFIPDNCFNLISNLSFNYNYLERYNAVLNYILRTTSPSYLKNIADVTEGLENRFLKYANTSNFCISNFIEKVKSKRYTYAKIQKAICHIILNITKDEQIQLINLGLNQYIKVLGFKKSSEDLLSELCNKALVPVITNINKVKNVSELGLKLIEKEAKLTDIFYLNTNISIGQEYREPLVIV